MHSRRGGFGYGFQPLPSSSEEVPNLGNFHPNNMEDQEFKVAIKKILEDFKNSSGKCLVLPIMTVRQRFLTHQIARLADLRSFSTGQEGNRYITICRPEGFRHFTVPVPDTFSIRLGTEQTKTILDYLIQYPIEKSQIERHYEPPNANKRSIQNGNGLSVGGSMKVPPFPSTPESADIVEFRRSLPAYKIREEIIQTINSHKVILITGGTGCGKTTQVPQFLLEEASSSGTPIRIICTQPRRLPAIAVAERVAKERGESVGGTVGYHIRLEQKLSPEETVLTYCTSGVLLRMLTVDSVAKNVSHIILDEIHEREQNTDYLLIALKEALKRRGDLKVILMSATMEGNRETFLKYFHHSDIASIDIPSRLHSVDKYFLDDVLAMTGYMSSPQQGNCAFRIENWNDRPMEPNPAFPASNGFAPPLHPSASTPAFSGNNSVIDNLASQLAGSVASSYNRQNSVSNFWSGDGFIESGYGWDTPSYDMRLPNICNVVAKTDKVLGPKPNSFNPRFAEQVRKADYPRKELVDYYVNYGTKPYGDGIDAALVKYCVLYLLTSEVSGSILVFLPGYDDILNVRTKLLEDAATLPVQPRIYTLHSQMNSADQQKVFERLPDETKERKVILSTNIAEASLTIDDVVFVIDCGLVKEKTYDHHSRISQLKVVWIAKSNAEQRSGRAGRCRHGYCFRLYSEEEYNAMNDTQVAEMKRAAIHDVCLHAKMFAPNNMAVKKFLGMAPEPPDPQAIENSFAFLLQLGALFDFSGSSPFDPEVGPPSYQRESISDVEPDLTELGMIIAHLPLEPQLARMLLYGVAFKCFNPIVTLVAALSHRDPFMLPLGEDRLTALNARDELGRLDYSDHLTLIRAVYKFIATPSRGRDICKHYFLGIASMKMIEGIRKQLAYELKRLNLIPDNNRSFDDPLLNEYSNSWPMVQAAIVAGCYPGIGVTKCQSRVKKIRTMMEPNGILHPGSVVKRQLQGARKHPSLMKFGDNPEPLIDFMVFQELSQIDEGLTLRTVTATTPVHVLLFAGSSRVEKVVMRDFEICSEEFENMDTSEFKTDYHFTREDSVEIDTFLGFRGEYETLKLLMKLRFKILNYFMMWLRDPSIATTSQIDALLKCVNDVLTIEHNRCCYQPVIDLPSKKEVKQKSPLGTVNNLSSIAPGVPPPFQNSIRPNEKQRREDKPIYRPPHLKKNEYTEEKTVQNGNHQYPEDFSPAVYQEEDEADQPPNGMSQWGYQQSRSVAAATKNLKGLLRMPTEEPPRENGSHYQPDYSALYTSTSSNAINVAIKQNMNEASSSGGQKKWMEGYSNDVRQSGLDSQRPYPRYEGMNGKPKQNSFNQRNRNCFQKDYNNGSHSFRSNGRQNDNSWDTRAAYQSEYSPYPTQNGNQNSRFFARTITPSNRGKNK